MKAIEINFQTREIILNDGRKFKMSSKLTKKTRFTVDGAFVHEPWLRLTNNNVFNFRIYSEMIYKKYLKEVNNA